jgi:hypothetical protein
MSVALGLAREPLVALGDFEEGSPREGIGGLMRLLARSPCVLEPSFGIAADRAGPVPIGVTSMPSSASRSR